MRARLAAAAAAMLFTTAIVAPAQADVIDFGQFSGSYANVVSGTTQAGVAFNITGSGAGFTTYEQDAGWNGTFAPNSALLFNLAPGQTTIAFSSALSSLSNFAVQSNMYGSYTATLVASLGGTTVGTYSLGGVSAYAPGTVPAFDFSVAGGFDGLNITTTNDAYGYGLGNASLPAAVPEPATWALMILGFGAVGGAMRRRRSIAAKVRFA